MKIAGHKHKYILDIGAQEKKLGHLMEKLAKEVAHDLVKALTPKH